MKPKKQIDYQRMGDEIYEKLRTATELDLWLNILGNFRRGLLAVSDSAQCLQKNIRGTHET